MPLYEYQCGKCGVTIEKIQKFSDEPLDTCERCKGPLERLISSSAIQFKGSGWYVTDYARKSSSSVPASSSSAKSEAPAEAKKSPAPSPSKPAAETK